ncbi:MAG: InlB B-repeat-containing protein [Treponema sp.]|nr:InlB B-repeat-containing protein [Treponema sp.]
MKKNKCFSGLAILLVASLSILALGSCPGPESNGSLFSVTYHANGEAVTVPPAQRVAPGSIVHVAVLPGYDPDTATNVFQGWNTEANGSGGIYSPGEPLTVNENINLYADWADSSGIAPIEGELTVVMQPLFPNVEGSTAWYAILVPEILGAVMVEPSTSYTISYSFSSDVAIGRLDYFPVNATGDELPTPGSDLEAMVNNGYPNIRALSLPLNAGSDIPANTVISDSEQQSTYGSSTFTASLSELANCIMFYTMNNGPEQPTLTFTKLTIQKTDIIRLVSHTVNGDVASGLPTSQIALTFDKPVYNLSVEDFFVYSGTFQIDSVVGSGTSYTLNITAPSTIYGDTLKDVKIVLVKQDGATSASAQFLVDVYTGWLPPPPPAPPTPEAYLKKMDANGNPNTTTTQLIIHVSEPMSVLGLTRDNIILSGMNVTKGTLAGGSEFVPDRNGYAYYLPISGFTQGGAITVTVQKAGWNIIHNLSAEWNYTTTVYYGYEGITYTGFLGKGYNVLHSPYYTSGEVKTNYILNMKRLIGEGKFVSDPDHYNSSDTIYIRGETLKKYAENFSLKMGISGGIGLFSASVSFSKNTANSIESYESFATSRTELIREKQNLTAMPLTELRGYLEDEFKNNWLLNNSVTPAQLFQNYGTHVFLTAYIGGRLDMGFMYHNTESKSATEIETSVRATYAVVSGSFTETQKTLQEEFTANSEEFIKTEGGSQAYGMETYAEAQLRRANWKASVDAGTRWSIVKGGNLQSITEMVPLWELIDPSNTSRRDAIKNHYDTQLAANGGLLFQLQKDPKPENINHLYMGYHGNNSALALSDLRSKSTAEISPILKSLNTPSEQNYLYLGYTTTVTAPGPLAGIGDIKAVKGGSNPTTPKVINGKTYHLFGYDANKGLGGDNIWLYANYQDYNGKFITDLFVEVNGEIGSMVGSGWERVKWSGGGDANMNSGYVKGLDYGSAYPIYIWMRR